MYFTVCFVFFFQAEDGIRDIGVTGVQTCALPISQAALHAVSCPETAMWTPTDRALVGGFGSGQSLTDDQFRLLEPLIPPARPGGRTRSADMRNLLDGLFYLVRTGCQWRHLPPPPAFALAHRVRLHARLPPGRGVGEHPPPVRG